MFERQFRCRSGELAVDRNLLNPTGRGDSLGETLQSFFLVNLYAGIKSPLRARRVRVDLFKPKWVVQLKRLMQTELHRVEQGTRERGPFHLLLNFG